MAGTAKHCRVRDNSSVHQLTWRSAFVPASEKLYTWWSYRAQDWVTADRGRRLDHIWVSQALGDRLSSINVTKDARGWERPSDHVPVTVTLEV